MGTQARNIAQILNTDSTITTSDIADDAVTSAKLDTNIAVAGTLGVTGATSLSNNLSLVKNQAAHTSIDVFNNSGSASAKGQIRVGYDASNCLEIFRVGNNANILLNATQNGAIIFQGAGSERIRLTGDGLTFNGDTAAANALDDYEEGTWTPFFTTYNSDLTLNGNASNTSSMYTTQGGSYIKIGRKVICHMSIATNGVTSHAGSGSLWIAGLPFTTVTTTASEPRGVNGAMGGRFNSFTPDQLVCNSNATTLQIRAGFEGYPTRSNLDTTGSGNRNVIEALIVYSTA